MTVFVVLAAGRGTRMGSRDVVHKALLPVDGRAVLSHQISLAPPAARLIVCTGHRASQIRDYATLAHPGLDVTFVPVAGWDRPGGGPGKSLTAARHLAGDDDLVFTSCDTLWQADPALWDAGMSWAGVAPVPAGTPPERWCRITSSGGMARGITDKTAGPGGDAYTGLAMITRKDLPAFWAGINADTGRERQVTGGLAALTAAGRLGVRQVAWTDTGDEDAYRAASGYDWAKPGQVTWVLPAQGRVVKYPAENLTRRHATISAAVPPLTGTRPHMLAYEYVPGVTGYEAAGHDPGLIPRLLDWAAARLWRPVRARDAARACDEFYRVKTAARIAMLPGGLRQMAESAVARVDWDGLATGCDPVTFHGDFNLGNIIVTPSGRFTAIDWRAGFAGRTWGDRRYDLAKLAAGLTVHWGNARRGNFAPWPDGAVHLAALAGWLGGTIPRDIRVIAALSLLNCAPLHAPPLDRVCVERGTALLEELA